MARIALVNGTLFDGTGSPPLPDATLLIEGSRLTAVGPSSATPVPEEAQLIDLAGRTVLPGLMDGHMHLTGMPGMLDEPAMLRGQLRASELLAECLRWGTTTVGHAAGCDENLVLRDMIDDGTLPGRARLIVSGLVTATGGHVRSRGFDGPWEIRKAVRRMAEAGFDFYKTCATGGFQWAHEGLGHPDYTPEELAALTAEAHMRSRFVHAHAHGQPGIQHAVDAGCDVILHGADIDVRALEGIAERSLIFMPTLYITSEHTWGDGRLPEHMTTRMKAAYGPHREGVARARELSIRIAAGTDGGPRPGALMHELCELVGCGLTPGEAIKAATSNTAAALGIEDRAGTLEAGKLADCIVVDGDPLSDISILTSKASLYLVVKEGSIVVDRRTA